LILVSNFITESLFDFSKTSPKINCFLVNNFISEKKSIKIFGCVKICIETNDIKNISVKRKYLKKNCAENMMQKYDFKKFSFVVFQLKDYFYIMYQYNYVIFL